MDDAGGTVAGKWSERAPAHRTWGAAKADADFALNPVGLVKTCFESRQYCRRLGHVLGCFYLSYRQSQSSPRHVDIAETWPSQNIL
jgi:hypothetical protein